MAIKGTVLGGFLPSTVGMVAGGVGKSAAAAETYEAEASWKRHRHRPPRDAAMGTRIYVATRLEFWRGSYNRENFSRTGSGTLKCV
jgi:hypothetical protein